MNKNIFGYLLIGFFVLGVAGFFSAAPTNEARITAVIKDVNVLARNSQPRAATLNDRVLEGNAVRTGGDSRAELTFADQTLTRIGANSVFSFGAGGKEFDLASGAMLLAAPKSAGTIKVNTAAATAAVTGFTAIFENKKTIVLEGEACVKPRNNPNAPCIMLHAGDLLLFENNRFQAPKKVSIEKIVRTGALFKFQHKLPKWSLGPINIAMKNQNGDGGTDGSQNPPGGYYNDQTGSGAIDQRNNASPPPQATPKPPPPSPPPSPPGL